MPNRTINCYAYNSVPGWSIRFFAPGNFWLYGNDGAYSNGQIELFGGYGGTSKGELQLLIDSSGGGLYDLRNIVNLGTGALYNGDFSDMMKMESQVGGGFSICYGYYWAADSTLAPLDTDKFYAYATASNSNWMGALTGSFPETANLPFCQFALPGAHDAGMNTMATIQPLIPRITAAGYTALALFPILSGLYAAKASTIPFVFQNFAMTQHDSIETMLNLGVRYFDFRPGYCYNVILNALGSKDLYHQHAVIPGMPYSQFLVDVLTWLAEPANSSEIVVVSCNTQGFANAAMNPTAEWLAQILSDARTWAQVPKETVNDGDASALGQTIAQLRASRTRLIFLNQINGETTKYDSYSDAAYKTLDPYTIVGALAGMNAAGQANHTYTVLQLQGTPTGLPEVAKCSASRASAVSSPLMAAKAVFDPVTIPWAMRNVSKNLSNKYLTVLLNDFVDNVTVAAAIEITKQRMGLVPAPA